jgi:hypothetical protein
VKKYLMLLGLTLLMVSPSFGETKRVKSTVTAVTSKPPVLSAELKLAYFKAQAEALQLQFDMQKLQDKVKTNQQLWQKSITDMNKACNSYTLDLDTNGDPICSKVAKK